MKNLLKTFLLGIFICLTINYTNAQKAPAEKGSALVGGSLVLSSMGGDLYEYDDKRLFNFQISPSYTAFFMDGLGAGAKMILGYQKQGDYSITQFAIGPQVVYYISSNYQPETVKGKIYPFIGTSFLYQSLSYKGDNDSDSETGTLFSIGGGMSVMLTNSVGLNFEVSYQADKFAKETGNKINFLIGIVAFL
jgi:hypothetical protein